VKINSIFLNCYIIILTTKLITENCQTHYVLSFKLNNYTQLFIFVTGNSNKLVFVQY